MENDEILRLKEENNSLRQENEKVKARVNEILYESVRHAYAWKCALCAAMKKKPPTLREFYDNLVASI